MLYAQLLSPDSHPQPAASAEPAPQADAAATGGVGVGERVAKLEQDVAALRCALTKLAAAMGEPDPLAAPVV